MPVAVDPNNLPPFSETHTGKAIRERLRLMPDEIAPKVCARNRRGDPGDEDDLLISVLWGYAKLAGIPVENLIYDDRDLWLGHRVN